MMRKKAKQRPLTKPTMTMEQLQEMIQHTRVVAKRSSEATDVRLKELHDSYDERFTEWQVASDDTPNDDRLVNCQVWTNQPEGGMLKEFGVPLRYRVVSNIGSWWTKDNRSFNGWVTYWKDFE